MTGARTTTLPDPKLFAHGAIARLLAAIGGDGEEIRVAGGAVRNALLGEALTDIDCATTTTPAETTRRAERAGFRVLSTGIEHGTVTVLVDGEAFEVTTLRADIATDGRRATVSFGRDFAADAGRRDFTINALYADANGLVTDHVGGLDDLAKRRVRFIGDADARIREDFLRILRLFRFHATYGVGDIDPAGLAACIRQRDGLDILSRERVRGELMKLFTAPRAVETVAAMSDAGFLTHILGGVVSLARLDAGVREKGDGFTAAARLALLAVESAEDVARLRERLSLSNAETETLARMAGVSVALRAAAFHVSTQAMKSLIYHGGGEIGGLLVAALVAAQAPGDAVDMARRAAAWMAPPLPWRGADALAAGVPAGPAVGQALARAERLWIEADFSSDPTVLDDIWARALRGL